MKVVGEDRSAEIAEDEGSRQQKRQKRDKKVVWINLREEPLLYINGKPFVLRDEHASTRNLTAFAGIVPERLEELELRLKEDVLSEALEYGGKILLHGEGENAEILPVWEEVDAAHVQTPREVFDSLAALGHNLAYHRVPITAGEPPEAGDFDALVRIICQSTNFDDLSFVFNCQMGIGRSTVGEAVAVLILDWMNVIKISTEKADKTLFHQQYEVVVSLLRVIRSASEAKKKVDMAIDMCASFINLREIISDTMAEAQSESDEATKKSSLRKGVTLLKRYFWLIAFKGYLNDTPADNLREMDTFTSWVQHRLEIEHMTTKIEENHYSALQPIHDVGHANGNALDEEVAIALNTRAGEGKLLLFV